MAQLGDLLAGAAGAPVNRPALDAYVTQGQAMAGLRTAQTEEALGRAQQLRDEQDAKDRLVTSLTNEKDGYGNPVRTGSEAQVLADVMRAHAGNYEQAEMGHRNALMARNTETASQVPQGAPGAQPNAPTPTQRTAAMQGNSPAINPYQNIDGQIVGHGDISGNGVAQTPVSQSVVDKNEAQAKLHTAQADNPGAFHVGGAMFSLLSPETRLAIHEGRLDPTRLNSRTAPLIDQLFQNDPGLDFNSMHSGAMLQSNATFQQRQVALETIPVMLDKLVGAGNKLGYSDVDFAGKVEQWKNGQLNDPAMASYMAYRNDLVQRLAYTMRGVGMSDKAIELEDQVLKKNAPPSYLESWANSQKDMVDTMIEGNRRASLRAGPPGSTRTTGQGVGGTSSTPAPALAPGASPGATSGPAGSGAAAAAVPGSQGAGGAPPINMLREGKITHFDNGQDWALRNGKPVLVSSGGHGPMPTPTGAQ